MAGAIAGTAILDCEPRPILQTVTLTVNNLCNLSCPHCYLQYRSGQSFLDEGVLEVVLASQYRHLAIVGKEPLVNAASIALSDRIAALAVSSGKTVSLITNGLNLCSVPPTLFENLAYIDVSLDGGPGTYEQYRHGSLSRLRSGLEYLRRLRFRNVNALHVLNDRTVDAVDDMMQVRDFTDFKTIMFSPYLETLNDGTNSVGGVNLESLLCGLAGSHRFMNEPRAFLLMDPYHLQGQELTFEALEELLARYGLNQKVKLIRNDPLHYGIIRVTYDGLALPPYDSIHPSRYQDVGYNVLRPGHIVRLEHLFRSMLESQARLGT